MKSSWLYRNLTGRIGTTTGHIGIVTDRISTITGRIGTQTTVRLSRKIDLNPSLCNRRHTLSVLRVFFLKKRNRYIFFKPYEVPAVFPLINFPCKGRVWTQMLLHRFFRRTCFLHTRSPRTVWWTSNKANNFFVQPYVQLVRIMSRNSASLFSPATISLASLHRTHTAHDTWPFSNGMPPSQLRTNWISIKWWMWSWLERTAPTICGYNVHIQIQLFSANLDNSQAWSWGPSKSWNSGKSRKIPISALPPPSPPQSLPHPFSACPPIR